MKNITNLVAILILGMALISCMPQGYQRETNQGPFSFMLGHPMYPCADREYTSKAITRVLNLRLGQKYAPTQKVSSVEGINSEENAAQQRSQNAGLTCHATITYENGTSETGNVIIHYLGVEGAGGSWVDWISDKDAPIVQAQQQQEKERQQKAAEDKRSQFFSSHPIREFPFEADISCTYGSNQLPIAACMQNGNTNTTIEVRNGQDYGMYQFMNLNIANSIPDRNGIAIYLRDAFTLRMQNASNTMTLNLKIKDRKTDSNVYQKSAAQFDYIRVNSDALPKARDQRSMGETGSGDFPYVAEISCGYQPIFACFMAQGGYVASYNTTLEIRNGDDYKLYQYRDLMNKPIVFYIPLREKFSIKAQNSNNTNILNIKISDKKSGKLLYQKSAGQLDYINIKN